MIIQLRGISDEFIAELKAATNERTASGAFEHAASEYGSLLAKIDHLLEYNSVISRQLDEALLVIEGARTAAALLLDRTSAAYLDLPEGH